MGMSAADAGFRLPAAASADNDFRRLRESGARPGLSRHLGSALGAARDALARSLVRCGVTPNALTVAGCLLTCAGGWCLVHGAGHQVPYWRSGAGQASWWPAGAALFLLLAGALDMLDGAVARIGNLRTRFGGILDSTLDRIGDIAIFVGCAAHFTWHANLTYQVLSLLALCNAFLISYVKARAENVVPDCSVGYWLRGERFAAVLIGCAVGHVPAALWVLGTLNVFTMLRRLDHAWRVAQALERGQPLPAPTPRRLALLRPWRHARGSVPYDLVTGSIIAFIVFAPRVWPVLLAAGPWADPLRVWLAP